MLFGIGRVNNLYYVHIGLVILRGMRAFGDDKEEMRV